RQPNLSKRAGQNGGSALLHFVGGAGPRSICPRSSADRAPASGAGCAGSSPAGGTDPCGMRTYFRWSRILDPLSSMSRGAMTAFGRGNEFSDGLHPEVEILVSPVDFAARRSSQTRPSGKEEAMKYVMLIYQGTALERQAALPEEEQKQVYADYQGINQTPGVTPGLPMGLPENATTVRVEGGKTLTTDGPFVGMKEAVGGWFILEADDLDAAIEVAARVPA